jgi:uncharacterized protein DUF4136
MLLTTHYGSRLASLAVLLALGACAAPVNPVKVRSEHDPTASFSSYRTYRWDPEPLADVNGTDPSRSQTLERRVRSAVDAQLARKGFQKAASRPDFVVTSRFSKQDKEIRTFRDYIAYRERGGKEFLSDAYVLGYEEGTLILEIFDTRTGRVVFHSSATAQVNAEQPERVEDSVVRMLATFPP